MPPVPRPRLSAPVSAPVAQLDRAPDYESGGQEFESLRARHFRTRPRIPAAVAARPATLFQIHLSDLRQSAINPRQFSALLQIEQCPVPFESVACWIVAIDCAVFQ